MVGYCFCLEGFIFSELDMFFCIGINLLLIYYDIWLRMIFNYLMIIINVFLYFIDVNECGNSELNKCLLKDMCVNI